MSPQAPFAGPRFEFDQAPPFRPFQEQANAVRNHWIAFLVLGVALSVLGFFALAYAGAASITTALVFGYVLVCAGVFYLVGAFFTRAWGGFFLSLVAGFLHLGVGLLVLDRPVEALVVYTLMMAVCFFVEGLVRVVGALVGRFDHWPWVFCSGVVSLLLGVLIWKQWPVDALFLVGIFVGINLVVSGAAYVLLGLNAKKLTMS